MRQDRRIFKSVPPPGRNRKKFDIRIGFTCSENCRRVHYYRFGAFIHYLQLRYLGPPRPVVITVPTRFENHKVGEIIWVAQPITARAVFWSNLIGKTIEPDYLPAMVWRTISSSQIEVVYLSRFRRLVLWLEGSLFP